MYESPISMISDQMKIISEQINANTDEMIVEAVQNVGVTVDKEEMIRALQYDRGQYNRGYTDGAHDMFSGFMEKMLEKYGRINEDESELSVAAVQADVKEIMAMAREVYEQI